VAVSFIGGGNRSKLELFYAYPQPLDREIIQPGLYIKATQENLKMCKRKMSNLPIKQNILFVFTRT
jgi:hypothetical protein